MPVATIWRKARARLSAYLAHPDPLTATTCLIAVVIGANGPFYPFYAVLMLGAAGTKLFWTMAASPFFLAIPLLARRNGLAGRLALPVVGTANTIWCAKLTGQTTGVELFLLPCILIAALSFRRRERLLSLLMIGVPMAAYLLLHQHYGAALLGFTPAQSASLLRLNAGSVGTLTAFLGLLYAGLRNSDEQA